MVSEYQQYQEATIEDDEYFEGEEEAPEEAWRDEDELYLILPAFFPILNNTNDKWRSFLSKIFSNNHWPNLSFFIN